MYAQLNNLAEMICCLIFSDACDYFASQLSPLSQTEQEEWLEKIVDYIQNQTLDAPFVEKELIEAAIVVRHCYLFMFSTSRIKICIYSLLDMLTFTITLDFKNTLKI